MSVSRASVDVAFLALALVSGAAFLISGRTTHQPGAKKLLYAAGLVVPLLLLAMAFSSG